MGDYSKLKKGFIPILLLVILLIISYSDQSNAFNVNNEEGMKRVLLISSYSPNFQNFYQHIEGIKSQFEGENIELDVEFMDTKRFYTDENINNFYKSLKYKVENMDPYDAIIVADDNALNFISEYQDELFKKIPIVFMGINNLENAIKASENPYITGVIENASIKETIEIASKLNSNATNVIAITDNTNSGQGELVAYYHEKNEFENLSLYDIDLSNYDFQEFALKLQEIDEDDIVLLLSVFSDNNNNKVTFNEGLQIVLDNCSQPIYYPYYQGLGDGIIGGKVISHYEQGSSAASIVKDIFNGKNISNIACIYKSPKKYIFDYNVIKAYGIDEKLLPKDTLLLNKKNSVLKKYLGYIVAASLILLFQFILIMVLQTNIIKRKKSEIDLIRSREKLVESNEELASTNEELTASLEEIRVQDQKIHHLIYCDLLTGLHNRFSIFQIIDNVINYEKNQGIMAVMFLDVDNFKNINDTYGHDIGDEVIKVIGLKLKEYENDEISIGRFGGDEFLIMIKNQTKTQDIIDFVEAIQREFAEQIVGSNITLFLTFSIGIVLFPYNGNNRSELVKNADLALYKAKDAGRNTYVFYENLMKEDLEQKMFLQRAIKEATKKKEFFLHYQPYVNSKTHKVIGFEALIRWISKEDGYVSPYKLITNAEEMGLILEIGEWVFKEASIFAKKINENRKDKLKVSINVSAVQLMSNEFYERTMEIVKETGVAPELICLEMTETILIESLESSTTVVQKLKEEGFQIALDDFGTGYSSLKYFKDLPVTILKIDKSFVDNITSSVYDRNLINAMTNIAHYRGVEVVAEGVETEDQLNILKRHGCDTIQGYLFSKPLSEEDTVKFIGKKD